MLPIVPLAIAFGLGAIVGQDPRVKTWVTEGKRRFDAGVAIGSAMLGESQTPQVVENSKAAKAAKLRRRSPDKVIEDEVRSTMDTLLGAALAANGIVPDEAFHDLGNVLGRFEEFHALDDSEWRITMCRDGGQIKLSATTDTGEKIFRVSTAQRDWDPSKLDEFIPCPQGKTKAYKDL